MTLTKDIYMLDRNVVSIIKASNSGKSIIDQDKLAMLDFLQAIDKPSSSITAIISIIEGQKGRAESLEEKSECMKKEAREIEIFFKEARTDCDTLHLMEKQFLEAFGSPPESEWNKYEEFLVKIKNFIVNPTACAKRWHACKAILAQAKALSIPQNHFLVMTTIARLYGNTHARDTLNPHKDNYPYNALSDIFMVIRFQLIIESAKASGIGGISFQLLSLDQGIVEFASQVGECVAGISADGDFSIGFSYPRKLFTEIDDVDFDRLRNALPPNAIIHEQLIHSLPKIS